MPKFEKGKSGNPATQFTSESQPANVGRKPNKLKELENQYELSKNDLENVLVHLLSGDMKEVKTIAMDLSQNAMVSVFARAILEAWKKGDLKLIKEIIDRVFGKIPEETKLDISGLTLQISKDDADL